MHGDHIPAVFAAALSVVLIVVFPFVQNVVGLIV